MIYLYHAYHLSNATHTNVSGSPFQEEKKNRRLIRLSVVRKIETSVNKARALIKNYS